MEVMTMYDAIAAIDIVHRNLGKTIKGYEDNDALTMDIACGLYEMANNLIGNIIDDYYNYYSAPSKEAGE